MFSSFFKSSSTSASAAASSLLSSSPGFELGPEVQIEHPEKQLFRVHDGRLTRSSLPNVSPDVSVFVCDDPTKIASATAAVKRLKTLRHPSIVTFVDSIESDSKVTLVTERVTPLSKHLDELDRNGVKGGPRDQYVAWGIFQVLRGLAFLNCDAKLRHNTLHGDAIFVNRAGDWKIFALERVTSTDNPYDIPASTNPALQKYDPPEVADHSKRGSGATPWSRDMWGVGCIIWEVFNGPLPSAKNLGQLGSIPAKAGSLYKELVAANPSKRPNPKEKLESVRRSGGYFKNQLIDVLLFIEELHLKDDPAKSRFYSSISEMSDKFPVHVGAYKIVPELVKAFEFGNAGAAIINPVFQLGSHLEADDYVRMVIPCILKLFASNDRNARFRLLNHVDQFVAHVSDKLVNDELFPQVQNGFADQEPIIREKSVIAMIHLAPKLNFSNLDECVVMKHFARLLRDEQASIRTNTTVCLGKIARFLHYQTRQKVLIAAFTGKLRDPFPPARIAAINALAATQQFFTIQETSNRILPSLCPTLSDPEEIVRKQGFKVTQGFIAKLEQVSKNPSLKEEMEAEVSTTNSTKSMSSSTVAGWASWAVGAIGAKFYKSKAGEANPPNPEKVEEKPRPTEEATMRLERINVQEEDIVLHEEEESKDEVPEDNAGGWDDAEDWGSLEDEKPPPAEEEVKEEKTSAQDWLDSWGNEQEAKVTTNKDRAEERLLREEKREQRRKELAAKRGAKKGGPMKLGQKMD